MAWNTQLDHVLWKTNTYLSVNNKKPVFEFVDHHNCRLGKWYYGGEGKQFFSSAGSYRNLEAPHAEVHNGTKAVFEIIKSQPIDYVGLKNAFLKIESYN